jgi:CO/xanthine dehydrogenase FAD-binding subunit
MVIAHDFDYVRPTSLDEAFDALSGAGPGARILAGGTDLVPWLRDELIEPELVVDIKAIRGLNGISVVDGRLEIGALVTFTDLLESDAVASTVPMFVEMAHQVASNGIRNRATIIGNVCSAVPSLDAGPALLVYDGTVRVARRDGVRSEPLESWILGPKTTRAAAGEIVTGISLELPAADHAAAFLKLGRYSGEDLAQANLAVLATDDRTYRVAFGAVAPRPFRAQSIEELLSGRVLDDDLIEAAVRLVDDEISPISDVRASAEYRTHMCRVMLARGLRAVVSRLAGAGPAYPTHLI